MIASPRRVWIAACAIALCGCASKPDGDRDRITDLARAERAFAAAAGTDGVKAAFLATLADDATLFRPGPVNGKAFFAARPERPFRLEWEPRRVTVAASGELGYSSGPSKVTLNAKPGEPSYGQFLTVWRRAPEGGWQVLIDHGISQPVPIALGQPVEAIEADGSRAMRTIASAEADFARRSASEGLASAYRAAASRRMRLLRDEMEPLDGLAGLAHLPMSDVRWTWAVTDSGTARSDDLAWTMGRYRTEAPKAPQSGGYFVRVWRVEEGDWKILAEVLAPIEEAAR